MAKVRCKACQNERAGKCTVKKTTVAVNKPRKCKAFILAEGKAKARESIPTQHVGYAKQQELKAKAAAERKKFLADLRAQRREGTARDLGILPKEYASTATASYETTDTGLVVPKGTQNSKHPMTGDLSRFTTTAVKPENTHASKVKV